MKRYLKATIAVLGVSFYGCVNADQVAQSALSAAEAQAGTPPPISTATSSANVLRGKVHSGTFVRGQSSSKEYFPSATFTFQNPESSKGILFIDVQINGFRVNQKGTWRQSEDSVCVTLPESRQPREVCGKVSYTETGKLKIDGIFEN